MCGCLQQKANERKMLSYCWLVYLFCQGHQKVLSSAEVSFLTKFYWYWGVQTFLIANISSIESGSNENCWYFSRKKSSCWTFSTLNSIHFSVSKKSQRRTFHNLLQIKPKIDKGLIINPYNESYHVHSLTYMNSIKTQRYTYQYSNWRVIHISYANSGFFIQLSTFIMRRISIIQL